MTVPRVATYRIQFRNGMTLDGAADTVPYLKRLGISHLYASPTFTATSGSTHGYDIIDYNQIDPALGGMNGFERLVRALKREKMGLMLDIVPNHMAASLENRWWHSVLERGHESPYARHFDIDWSRKLTLPILGRTYEEALAEGELTLSQDPASGGLALSYFDNRIPLHPATYPAVAARLSGDAASRVAAIARERATDPDSPTGQRPEPREERELGEALTRLSSDRAWIDALIDAQPWRLLFWQDARRDLSYRRFFEVTGLVGVRVENPDIFADVHRLVLSLVHEGMVDGLRVDHVDGLAAPTAYLNRLRQEVGPDVWLVVEKILGQNERLPPEWRRLGVGTTGYEFIPAMTSLMVNPAGTARLREGGRQLGDIRSDEDELRAAKLLILKRNFEGELGALARLAADLAGESGEGPNEAELEKALTELIVAFPVYRTYIEAEGPSVMDYAILSGAASDAVAAGASEPALRYILDLMTTDLTASQELSSRFRTRFQQLTGPVMAKSVEDTFFYRDTTLIALNEVGATPLVYTLGASEFHRFLGDRAGDGDSLLATSTHDTKRGEDARARLYAIAADAHWWLESVRRWTGMNAGLRTGPSAADPQVEWLLYQALAGVWPINRTSEEAPLGDIRNRLLGFVEKALREAKLRTDWLAVDVDYERSVLDFGNRLLDPANGAFIDDFARTMERLMEAGAINSLSQTMAKLTGPGVPDIYQGSERGDFSLVDPDNRRPIDFKRMARDLEAGAEHAGSLTSSFEDRKQDLTARLLSARARHLALFAEGCYTPLAVRGQSADRIVAYMRELGEQAALVVLERAISARSSDTSGWEIEIPARYDGAEFRDVLTDTTFRCGRSLAVSRSLGRFPVTLYLAGID